MVMKSVLIADDDPMLVRVLTVRCRHLGVEVRQASDAMQALVMIHKDPPDAVIMDVAMPAGDGISACEMMVSDHRLRDIPIIIVTGQSSDAIRERARKMGAHYLLKSPELWTQLKPLLCRLLDLDGNDGDEHDRSAPVLPKSGGAGEPSKKPMILVVDDDHDVTRAVRVRLEANGYQVICAHSGSAAYWMAMEQRPALITLDLTLPELDGLSLLGKLKAHPSTKAIPIIILTGTGNEASQRQFLQAGASAYLTKPFDTRHLLATVKEILAAVREAGGGKRIPQSAIHIPKLKA